MKLHKALWRHQEVSKNQLMTLVSYAVLYINYCLPWKHATLIACKNPRKHNFYFDLLIFNIAVILKNSSGTKTDTKELQLYKKISSWKVWRGIVVNFFFLSFEETPVLSYLPRLLDYGLLTFLSVLCISHKRLKTILYEYHIVQFLCLQCTWVELHKGNNSFTLLSKYQHTWHHRKFRHWKNLYLLMG